MPVAHHASARAGPPRLGVLLLLGGAAARAAGAPRAAHLVVALRPSGGACVPAAAVQAVARDDGLQLDRRRLRGPGDQDLPQAPALPLPGRVGGVVLLLARHHRLTHIFYRRI